MQTKAANLRFPAPEATVSVHGLFRTSEPARIRAAIIGGNVRAAALRKLRLNLHLTIDDIACALGVSSRTVVRKEHDKTPVRMLDTEVGAEAVTESLSVIAYGGVS
jgi:uncharacterized protein (DUF2384 family)